MKPVKLSKPLAVIVVMIGACVCLSSCTGALLWFGSNQDYHDAWPYQAMEAAQRGDADTITQLIHKQADVFYERMPDYPSRNCLMEAARRGHVNVVHLLLEKNVRQDYTLEGQDSDGKTALMLARENHYEDIVRLLLRAGATR